MDEVSTTPKNRVVDHFGLGNLILSDINSFANIKSANLCRQGHLCLLLGYGKRSYTPLLRLYIGLIEKINKFF
jgi:hypothetical protein